MMNRTHPFSLLLAAILALGILGLGSSVCWLSNAATSICESEEDSLSDCMEELLDALVDSSTVLFAPGACVPDAGELLECSQSLSEGCSFSLHKCSFGWMLPLRI